MSYEHNFSELNEDTKTDNSVMYLMCKNTKVYNITTGEVLAKGLLPGYMSKNPCSASYRQWMKYRYSSGTNTLARRLKGIAYGQGKRALINQKTHALSLCDCYWIKKDGEDISFEEISPYYASFDPDEFTEADIVALFGEDGVKMLIFDAIIGNGDRHAGNFGWLRDANNGEYLSMAPLYDFDHALDSTLEWDRLMEDAVYACKDYKDTVTGICQGVIDNSSNEIFIKRAHKILSVKIYK